MERERHKGPLSLPCLFKQCNGSHLFLWTPSGVFWGALWQLLNNLEMEESQKSSRGVLPVARFSYEKSVYFCWCLLPVPVTFLTRFGGTVSALCKCWGARPAFRLLLPLLGSTHCSMQQWRCNPASPLSSGPGWCSSGWLQPGDNLLLSLTSGSSLPACWPQKPMLSVFVERLCSPEMKR